MALIQMAAARLAGVDKLCYHNLRSGQVGPVKVLLVSGLVQEYEEAQRAFTAWLAAKYSGGATVEAFLAWINGQRFSWGQSDGN